MLRVAITGLAVAGCTVLPSRKLRTEVEDREAKILRQLPDIMDLLVICMEAGLGFTSAVSRTVANIDGEMRSEEHTSELQSLMRISYAVFCLNKKKSRQSMRQRIHS